MNKNTRKNIDANKYLAIPIWVAMITGIGAIIVALFTIPPFQQLFDPTTLPTLTLTRTASPPITPTTISTKATPTSGSGNSNITPEIQQLKTNMAQLQNSNSQTTMKVDELGTRLEAIESIILEDPAKVLQTTVLINEVNALKSETQRMNNLYLGILGLIFTLAIGIFTLAVSYRKQSVSQANNNDKMDLTQKLSDQVESLMKVLALEKAENNELRNITKQQNEQIENLRKQINSNNDLTLTKPE